MAKQRHTKANKRTISQRAADRELIAKLHLRGHSHTEIAEILSTKRPYTLSRQQISADLAKLAAQWQKSAERETSIILMRELESLKIRERELWKAWERSKEPLVIENERRRADGTLELTRVTKSRTGNVACLRALLEIISARSLLLGLYPKID